MAISQGDLNLIRNLPLFEGIADDTLRALLKSSEITTHARRAMIFEQGDPVTHFFGILSGWVKLFRLRPDGAEVVIEVFGAGECFAEGTICMDAYPVSAELVEDGRLLAVPVAEYTEQLREDPDLMIKTIASLAVNLKRLASRIEIGSGVTSSQRVGAFLLGFCPPTEEGTVNVKLPYDKNLIACRLDMKPETFSRALVSLREHGVTVERRNARIANPALLRRYSFPE